MIRKLKLTMSDIFPVILLPFIFTLFFTTTYEYLLLLYLFIAIGLCHVNIENDDRGQYGSKIYVSHQSVTSCLFKLNLSMSGLFIIAKLANLPLAFYSLGLMIILMIAIYVNQATTIYENGIRYRGRFYTYEQVSQGHLVKNYQAMYEIHIGHQKMVMNNMELALTKKMVSVFV